MKKSINQNICIFGMGFVGLTLSIVLAEKGFKIYGLEKNEKILKNLQLGKSQLFEPNIESRLKKVIKKKNLIFRPKLNKSIICNNYIITVGTPLNKNKKANLEMIQNVSKEISKFMKDGDHIILRSTVKIGTTDKLCKQIFNKTGKFFTIGFCPERTIEGNALKELKILPQIISGNSKESSSRSIQIFKHLNNNIIEVDNFKTAEMIKLVDNVQRDVKFALSNEIAQICEFFKINTNEVIRLGKKNYKRTNLFDAGPVGGPCLEKDTYILKDSLEKKYSPVIAINARKTNEKLISKCIQNLKKILFEKNNFIFSKKRIVVCGFAFKGIPETNDMRGSTVYPLINLLKKNFKNCEIFGHDDLIDKSIFKNLNVKKINNKESIFKKTDLLIIHNNNRKYKKYLIKKNINLMNCNATIYDFWNNFNNKFIIKDKNISYHSLGNI